MFFQYVTRRAQKILKRPADEKNALPCCNDWLLLSAAKSVNFWNVSFATLKLWCIYHYIKGVPNFQFNIN